MNDSQKNSLFGQDFNVERFFVYAAKKKYFIIFLSSSFILLSLIIAFFLPNVYRSEVLLAPASQSSFSNDNLSGFSSIASLAGIKGSPSSSKSDEALKKLKSFKFFHTSFLPSINLEDLMAVSKWDPKSNLITYKKFFDVNNGTWSRNVSFPLLPKPSAQEAFRKFKEIYSIYSEDETGFVTIAIEHKSPFIAKEWVNIIVESLNENFREEDKAKALLSIEYINSQIAKTSLSEVKLALSQLMQQEIKTLMLIEADSEYIFKVLDPPIVSEMHWKPKRVLIVSLGTVLGILISLVILIYMFLRKFNDN